MRYFNRQPDREEEVIEEGDLFPLALSPSHSPPSCVMTPHFRRHASQCRPSFNVRWTAARPGSFPQTHSMPLCLSFESSFSSGGRGGRRLGQAVTGLGAWLADDAATKEEKRERLSNWDRWGPHSGVHEQGYQAHLAPITLSRLSKEAN